jgi:uncharacterized protein YeeX (DUF496 family)
MKLTAVIFDVNYCTNTNCQQNTVCSNSARHRDLEIETVTDIIAKFAKSHEKRLQDHINIEAFRILKVNNITRRLKRKKPPEQVKL